MIWLLTLKRVVGKERMEVGVGVGVGRVLKLFFFYLFQVHHAQISFLAELPLALGGCIIQLSWKLFWILVLRDRLRLISKT